MKIKVHKDGVTTLSDKATGVTVGYRKINRMVQVSVAFKAPADKWSAKVGKNLVRGSLAEAKFNAEHFGCGKAKDVISLPFGALTDEATQERLNDMFIQAAGQWNDIS